MKHLLPLLLAVAWSCPAAAGVREIAALSLPEALALAERQHPDLAEARALIEAADARVQQAGRLPNPEGIVRMESAPLEGRTLDRAEYLAGVAQTVPLGGRLGRATEAEREQRERQRRELEVRRRELHRRVQGAFATALYQDQALRTQRGLAEGAEQAVRTTRARVEAGDAPRGDLARVELEAARVRTELQRAEAGRGQALTALTATLGDASLVVRGLEGTLEAAFEIPALESLVAGLEAHPVVAVAEAELRASRAQVDLAKAERIPDVRVEVLYRRLQGERENALDAGFSIPLPVWDRNQGRLREARAGEAAAAARSRAARNDLTLRLREAHAQLSAALATSRAWKTDVLPRAEIVRKAAEVRYAAGDISLGEVLPVRRDWAELQLAYLESLRDVMQAWADLGPLLPKS